MNGKGICNAVQEGDFVGLVCKTPGLDISHMGMVVKNEKGELVVIDASMTGGKVMKEPKPIVEYLPQERRDWREILPNQEKRLLNTLHI